MIAVLSCPDGQIPITHKQGLNVDWGVNCDGGGTPTTSPITIGLSDLAWSDVSLLIGALLLTCCVAVGFNLLGKMFFRG